MIRSLFVAVALFGLAANANASAKASSLTAKEAIIAKQLKKDARLFVKTLSSKPTKPKYEVLFSKSGKAGSIGISVVGHPGPFVPAGRFELYTAPFRVNGKTGLSVGTFEINERL